MNNFHNTVAEAIAQGGIVECGGKEIDREGFFVEPTIISHLPHDAEVIQKETFAPIVYILKAESLNQAIEWNNEVKQGLSSALFSTNISSVFKVRTVFTIYACCFYFFFISIEHILFVICSGLDRMDPIVGLLMSIHHLVELVS